MHARNGQSYARPKEAMWALGGLAPRQKMTACALGISQSALSRQISGETEGDVARFYEVVRRAVEDRRTRNRAGRLVAGALLSAQEAAEGLTRVECRAALNLALDYETEATLAEDVATHRVLRAVARTAEDDATPDDLHELSGALQALDHATCEKIAAHSDVLYFARGYLALVGGER